jgi:hypothetical protein
MDNIAAIRFYNTLGRAYRSAGRWAFSKNTVAYVDFQQAW